VRVLAPKCEFDKRNLVRQRTERNSVIGSHGTRRPERRPSQLLVLDCLSETDHLGFTSESFLFYWKEKLLRIPIKIVSKI
jgi:hypothetical protein